VASALTPRDIHTCAKSFDRGAKLSDWDQDILSVWRVICTVFGVVALIKLNSLNRSRESKWERHCNEQETEWTRSHPNVTENVMIPQLKDNELNISGMSIDDGLDTVSV
jgi:hypothetical protein